MSREHTKLRHLPIAVREAARFSVQWHARLHLGADRQDARAARSGRGNPQSVFDFGARAPAAITFAMV